MEWLQSKPMVFFSAFALPFQLCDRRAMSLMCPVVVQREALSLCRLSARLPKAREALT